MTDATKIILENTSPVIADLDCGTGTNADVGTDICMLTKKENNGFGEDTGKPTSYVLTLGDELTSVIDSSQGDKLEVGAVGGADDGDGSYFIVVSKKVGTTNADEIFFSGTVDSGDSFTAAGSFGSETFVQIYSSQGGSLLQTINFHTSCSAPLVIGDQYGSITLEGATLEGKDSGTIYTVGQTETDGDAGVVYEITGGSDADDFVVDPDTGVVTFKETPDFENPTDSNGDNKYDVVVTAFYVDENGNKTGEICEVKPLEVCVEDDCINVLENTSPVIADLDCGTGTNADVGTDICMLTKKENNGFGEDTGKPTSYVLTLGDELTSVIDSSQGDKLEVGAVGGADDGDGSYFIVVSKKVGTTNADEIFFSGTVDSGDSFTAAGSFGSETFVQIYSSQGGSLLQTINFHTSCSAPLVIGDQYGSITLEGATLEGKDSGTIYTVGQTETDGDAGVVYEITGGSDADDFVVDPDTGVVTFKETPDFENPTDSNGDNKYDVVVTAFYVDENGNKTGEICEVKPLEVCVEDDCINILENTSPVIADLDCGTGTNADVGTDICMLTKKENNGFGEDTGKPTSYVLTLGDELTSVIDSSQGDKLEVGAVGGADDGDGSYFIVVSKKVGTTNADEIFFSGTVDSGDSFTAAGSFGSETFVQIYSSQGGSLLQTINFHTSCSAPLVIGDQYGSITLEGATLEGKDSGTIYTVGQTETDGDAGVVYEITGGSDADDFVVDPDTGVVTFKETPDFENPTDSNGDNKYDVVVTAFYVDENGNKTGEICEVKPLEVCVQDQDCIEISENTTGPVTDLDLTVECADEEPADTGLFVCQAIDEQGLEKPSELILTLGDVIDPKLSNFQPDGKSSVATTSASEDGDGLLRVIVSDDDDPTKLDTVYFDGAVSFGDTFTALASNAGDDTFASNTYVHIFDDDGTLLQTIQYHMSCSAPIVIGDQVGSVTVTGVGALNKDTGQIVTFGGTTQAPQTLGEGDIVYSIVGGDDAGAFTVDPDTGEVSFIDAPDFEAASADGDDNYEVIVRATAKDDPDCFTDTPVEICVTDVAELGSIAGRYFCDLDEDGLDNNNGDEPGEAGVRVFLQLRDAAGDISFVAETQTDANGEYVFEDLPAGDYRVIFAPVDGKVFVDPNVGQMGDMDPADDSDVIAVNPVTGRGATDFIPLAEGEDRTDVDAGVEFTAALGDLVFEDDNANGIQDAGEAGIGGVGVTLTGGGADGVIGTADDTTETTTTAADGSYLFDGLTPGEEYQVTFDQAAGFDGVSPADAGGDDAVDSDGLVAPVVTLASGEVNDTIDQGFYKTASLGDFVFEDLNGDGIQDAGEPGVANVTVALKDAGGNVVATTTTGGNGQYSFTGLIPGAYSVAFTPPPGFQFTALNAGGDDALDSDADPAMGGMTEQVTLTSGEFNGTLDAGLVRTAALGDLVFEDDNANGIQDAGEAGIGGVGVTLTGGGADGVIGTADDTTETTTTAADGSYLFDGLTPGEEYQVTFDQAAGFDGVSPADAGGDDAVDSDGLVAPVVTLASGEVNDTIDQGFYKTASLGDFVFEDLNGDGIQDAGEPGVANVTVALKDAGGNVVATTTTGGNGQYSFTGLIPGAYSVAFTPPPGFQFTALNAGGDDALDSDADPAMGGMTEQVTLTSGEFNGTLDAGLVRTAALGDLVFEDDNANGIQDAGEAGIGGVGVTLTGGGADGVIGTADDTTETTTTAADGSYLFDGLTPGEEYQVTFDQAAGFDGVSPADAGGDDAVDSDGLVAPVVTLASGEVNDTIDQGFYKTASLGDFVFEDLNGDGIQDAGEPGVANVTVALKDAGGNVVATTTTGGNGQYSFTGLIPGAYSVAFTPPPGFQFTALNAGGDDALDSDADPAMGGMTEQVTLTSGEFNGTLDAGLVRTAALGDLVFEDDNANGIQDAGEAGIGGVGVTLTGGGADGVIGTADDTTETTTTAADGSYLFDGLTPGEEYQVTFDQAAGFDGVSPADAGGDDAVDSDGLVAPVVTLASGEVNDTIDQGFYKTASLGDFVFEDLNGDGIQDAGEPGVANVTVALKDAGGNVVATTTTGGNGQYSFTGLIPGAYSVAFTPPPGFQFTALNAGGDDALDSDADPAMGGMTEQVTLTSGEFNGTLDAGLVRTAAPVAKPDAGAACAGDPLVLDVTANDSDADGDPITVEQINGVSIAGGGSTTLMVDALIFDTDGVTLLETRPVTLDAMLSPDGTTFTFEVGTQLDDLLIDQVARIETLSYEIGDGTGNFDVSEIDLKFCGALNLVETIDNADAPRAQMNIEPVTAFVPGEGFSTVRNEIVLNFDDPAFNDVYQPEYDDPTDVLGPDGVRFDYGYCLDQSVAQNADTTDTFVFNSTGDVNVAGPTGASLADLVLNVENLDSVNWILNQSFETQTVTPSGDGAFSFDDIQDAIWALVDGLAPGSLSQDSLDIYEHALIDGDGFVPKADGDPTTQEVVGLILKPVVETSLGDFDDNGQLYIVGVPLDDCLC